jgi:hypothetical protein
MSELPVHSHSEDRQPFKSEGHAPGLGDQAHVPVSPPIAPGATARGAGLSHPVELHIEELVLHGFAPDDRYGIGDVVERELTRLFTEQGVPPALIQNGEITRLDGGAFQVQPGSNAETTGIQLATAIYRGFGK